MGLYKGSEPIAGLAINKIITGFNTFDCKWSDHLINDIQWLRADTFSWQSGDVYVTAYNKLVEEYATGTTETEGSITFKRSANGYKIASSDQEQAIMDKYNTDNIAWYYILDTANKRFKLPRTKFGFEGLRTNVGDDITESLPNITGSFKVQDGSNRNLTQSANGAFTLGTTVTTQGATSVSGSITRFDGIKFNASDSSSTYQDGAPVQERATQMYLYFYVGEYTREAIEQTAGLNAEMFNGKADVTTVNILSNTVNSVAERIYLKTAYVSGTSGYNIWSNGYCEQWGYVSGGSTSNTISLLKTFKNTNYLVILTLEAGQGERYSESYTKSSTSKFVINASTTGVKAAGKSWKVCGYLAEGQY